MKAALRALLAAALLLGGGAAGVEARRRSQPPATSWTVTEARADSPLTLRALATDEQAVLQFQCSRRPDNTLALFAILVRTQSGERLVGPPPALVVGGKRHLFGQAWMSSGYAAKPGEAAFWIEGPRWNDSPLLDLTFGQPFVIEAGGSAFPFAGEGLSAAMIRLRGACAAPALPPARLQALLAQRLVGRWRPVRSGATCARDALVLGADGVAALPCRRGRWTIEPSQLSLLWEGGQVWGPEMTGACGLAQPRQTVRLQVLGLDDRILLLGAAGGRAERFERCKAAKPSP